MSKIDKVRMAFVAAAIALVTVQPAHASTTTWNLAGGGDWDTTTANWTGDSTTFTDDGTVDVIFDNAAGGTITIAADMSPLSTTVNSSGNYTFNGGPIDSGSLTKAGDGVLTLSGLNTFSGDVNISGGTLVAGVSAGVNTQNNPTSGTALGLSNATRTITVGSAGTLDFSVANVFTNNFAQAADYLPTLVIAGTMTNSGTATNSALGNITLTNGTLTYTTGSPVGVNSGEGYGAWNLNGTVTSTGSSFISSGNAGVPVTLSAAPGTSTTFDVLSGTLTASAVLGEVTRTGDAKVSALVKTGSGTMVLSGSNAYTGTTTINGGTLTLDYSTNNDSKLADSAALNLGGGTLTLSGGSHTEVVGSTTLLQGQASKITRSSGTSVLQMGDITRQPGATLDFGAPDIVTTTTANTNGILGGWATVNSLDLAANNGSDSIIAYTGYTDVTRTDSGTKVIPNDATANIRVVDGTGSTVADIGIGTTTNVSVNTILFNQTGGTASIRGTTNSRFLETSAIIVPTGAANAFMRISNSGGGIRPLTDGGELLLNIGTDRTLTIQSTQIRNKTSASSLVKTGGGLVNLFGGNVQMTGAVKVQEGTLFFNNHTATSVTSPTSWAISGGAALDLQINADTANLTGAITIDTQADNSATLLYSRSGTTTAGTLTLDEGINGTGNMDFVAKATPNGGLDHVLILGAAGSYTGNTLITSNNSDTVLTVRAGVNDALPTTTLLTINGIQGTADRVSAYDLNGKDQTLAGLVAPVSPDRLNQIQNSAGTASLLTINNAADYDFAGQITGDNLALAKTGAGTQTLSGANTHTGATTISGGILNLGNSLALQNSAFNTTGSNGTTIGLNASGGLDSGKLTLGGLAGSVDLASAITAGYTSVTNLTLNPQVGTSSSYSGIIADGATGMTLVKTGAGTQVLTSDNTYTGGTEVNEGTVRLASGPGTSPAGSGAIQLGATSGSADATIQVAASGTNPANDLIVRTGSAGTKTLANASANTVTYSGNITANDDLTILGAYAGGRLTISGTNTIAAGKTVSFSNTGTGSNILIDSAVWSGDGSISYTSSSSIGFAISGANTYSGGTTLGAMSGTGIVVAQTSSTGPANAPTDGSFGTGTLSIGATQMRAATSVDIIIGNPVTFTDNPTFTTVAGEKSLIFTGDVSLGATRTITADVGSTVAGTYVEFQGNISGSGFGIAQAGTGTLRLSGTNTYTGDTIVQQGILSIANPYLYDASTVNIGMDGQMNLDFGDIGIKDTIAALILNGNTMLPGTYNRLTPTYGTYFTGDGSLLVPSDVVPGDANGDGVVDAADYIIMKRNFGQSANSGPSYGDINDSGATDWADLQILIGAMGGVGGAQTTIPEPATLGLLAIGAVAILRRRRA